MALKVMRVSILRTIDVGGPFYYTVERRETEGAAFDTRRVATGKNVNGAIGEVSSLLVNMEGEATRLEVSMTGDVGVSMVFTETIDIRGRDFVLNPVMTAIEELDARNPCDSVVITLTTQV